MKLLRPLRLSELPRVLAGHHFRILAMGFAAIEFLIIALIGVSLYSMGDVRQNLDRLSVLLQSKGEAMATMRENLYLRLASSRDMMVMEDPFEIDEEAQRFHVYASRIGRAHARFLELTDDPGDRLLAQKFMDAARNGMPLLNTAVNELLSGRRAGEIEPLLNRAFESQKLALDILGQLQERVQTQSLHLTQEAVTRYERTRVLIIALTLVALVLVLAIALIVARLLAQKNGELERQHRRYKTLFDANRDAVLIVQNGKIVEGNRCALEWFDYLGRGNLRGTAVGALSATSDGSGHNDFERMLEQVADDGGTFEWPFRDRTGQPFFGEVSLSPLPTLSGSRAQVVVRDVTERTLALKQMSHDASHDPMTGLANRREFERRVNQAIDSARGQMHQHTLCYLDLDKFKDVNDIAGHAAGDELLKKVAAVFKLRSRTADLVARLGGDEFGLLLENCTIERASAIVKAISHDIEALQCQSDAGPLHIGVSAGLIAIDATSPPFETIVQLADEACYEAKRSGTGLQIADGR